jgi:ribosome-associated protein
MDYSSVVVHIFTEEAREFYSLERLWSDATPVDVSQYLSQD